MIGILLINIIGQFLADAELADEFVNFVVIPIDHILTLLGVIG